MNRFLIRALLSSLLAGTTCADLLQPRVEIRLGSDTEEQNHPLPYRGNSLYATELSLTAGNYQLHFEPLEGDCQGRLGAEEPVRVRFNNPLPLVRCAEASYELRLLRDSLVRIELNNKRPEQPTLTLSLEVATTRTEPFRRPLPQIACDEWQGEAVTVDVSDVFSEEEWLVDFYSGQSVQVKSGQVSLTPATGSNGLLLLERKNHVPRAFSWDNATVYFVMPDRFYNGDPSNDHSFGRRQDGGDNIGTFHGGDLAGLIQRLDHIQALGADALWMTPIVEQVHGFIGGGKESEFPFYAYHGYWALDYTRLDPNFGTEAELQTLITEARQRGIRLIWDVVINHVGYATLADLIDYDVDVLHTSIAPLENGNDWQPGPGENWSAYQALIDDESPNWASQWWGPDWVRAHYPGYRKPGTDNLTLNLAGLPDFITESTEPVGLPPILRTKPDTRAADIERPVIDHVIDWQVDWVRRFGIDGFRSDTAKHVELEHWQRLKDAASEALEAWRRENPHQALDDTPFWMVGEVFDHPLFKNYYYDYGFDSLINFSFQDRATDLAQCFSNTEPLFARYAQDINSDPDFNGLTYISSHDTTLFYANYQSVLLQKRVAAPFLLLPGAVQIYYGDETARPLGPYASDFHQGTRSPMNWDQIEGERAELLTHWQKIGQFRNRHKAIGAGEHRQLSQSPYAFSRVLGEDAVVVVFAGNETPKP